MSIHGTWFLNVTFLDGMWSLIAVFKEALKKSHMLCEYLGFPKLDIRTYKEWQDQFEVEELVLGVSQKIIVIKFMT